MLAAGITPRLQFGEVPGGSWRTPRDGVLRCGHAGCSTVRARPRTGDIPTPNDESGGQTVRGCELPSDPVVQLRGAIQSYVLSQCPRPSRTTVAHGRGTIQTTASSCGTSICRRSGPRAPASGFDTFLIEGYQTPDQHTTSTWHPLRAVSVKEWWDQAHCRYLMGLYYGTWPWLREFVNIIASDSPRSRSGPTTHLCLFGWPVPLPRPTTAHSSTDAYGKPRNPPQRGGPASPCASIKNRCPAQLMIAQWAIESKRCKAGGPTPTASP